LARKSATGPSALEALRRYQWRIALTYTLTLVEDLLELSYPWATGIAINGVLNGQIEHAAPLIIAWAARSTIGLIRRMYDTRLYTRIYNHIVEMTILRQRRAGVPATRVAARSAMSREFVTFFEKDVATLVTTFVGIFGSLAMLLWYDLIIGAMMACLFVPIVIVNNTYVRKSFALNRDLNNQLEEEVKAIESADPEVVKAHFTAVRTWRVKLSDAEAFNWSIIEVLSILLLVGVLVRITYMGEISAGAIFAMIVYVWQFLENLDNVPELLQQLARLQDIRKRIEAGASVESIGAEIEKSADEGAEATRM
jgi:ABC-type multidrug transport system fused ATPase/permease subunit